MLDNLMTFYKPGQGFVHTSSGSGNSQMSTEQGFYGMIAARRARDGKPTLYRMTSDALKITGSAPSGPKRGEGLRGKHADVQPASVTSPGKTFDDVYTHENLTAIDALAARGVIDGKGDGKFHPGDTMTRAEYCAVVARALSLRPGSGAASFTDVKSGEWYYDYVRAMSAYKIAGGVGDNRFNPGGTITRQEAAVMTARAASLCGIDTSVAPGETRDILSQFGDYVKSADWARDPLAACYREGILSESDMDIRPNDAVTRGEIAQMLFNMLGAANLL
jgi:hypothetical protein